MARGKEIVAESTSIDALTSWLGASWALVIEIFLAELNEKFFGVEQNWNHLIAKKVSKQAVQAKFQYETIEA